MVEVILLHLVLHDLDDGPDEAAHHQPHVLLIAQLAGVAETEIFQGETRLGQGLFQRGHGAVLLDQLVHALGFGITAWVLWHVLTRHYPDTRGTWTALAFPALASMGLGATNEIIEFAAVLAVPDTNVGGYYNTALDLCFNALGAVVAMGLVRLFEPRA